MSARSPRRLAWGLAFATSLALGGPRVVFTGDILLSRLVAREIIATSRSPWQGAQGLFGEEDLVIGNLEGAVGERSACLAALPPSLCFDVNAAWLPLARQAGFSALGLENNHAADLGEAGRAATAEAVARAGMRGLGTEASPQFLQLGDRTVGIVSLSRVADALGRFTPLDIGTEQKLDTARALSDASIAYVHWGTELQAWPDEAQYQQARTLVRQGAELVVGHHPHVVQAPACVDGHPVFFSLGNHVFDQKYPATHEGMLAACAWTPSGLQCEGRWTRKRAGSHFPEAGDRPAAQVCQAPHREDREALSFDGIRVRARASALAAGGEDGLTRLELWAGSRRLATESPRKIRRAARIQLAPGAPPSLFVLEDHYSSLDRQIAPRPYIYAVKPSGLSAQWRGSALTYPLVDATVLPASGGDLLCALHRYASFLAGAPPGTPPGQLHTLAYRWSDFGFVAAGARAEQAACAARYAPYLGKAPRPEPAADGPA